MSELRDRLSYPEWYDMLDPGIRFAVKVMHAHGIETGQSCQGGAGHAYDRPTIDLWGDARTTGFAALHHLSEYDLGVRDIALMWTIEDGLPIERFWRLTFRRTHEERADEWPMFVWDAVPRP